MSQVTMVSCGNCGAAYPLTAEYLSQYGGQQTQCSQCSQPFLIPHVSALQAQTVSTPVPVLAYSTPGMQGTAGVWSEGKILIAATGAARPYRCVKCNEPADGVPKHKTFYWHEPWIYVFVVVAMLIYIILALTMRKSGSISYSLCARHRARRLRFIIGAWMGAAGSVVCFVIAGNNKPAELFVAVGFVLILGSLIVGLIGSRVLAPKRIDARYLWLKGAGPEFLRSLPDARAAV